MTVSDGLLLALAVLLLFYLGVAMFKPQRF